MFQASSLPIIRSFLLFNTGKFYACFDDRFHAEAGWNCSSSLTVLGSGHQNPYKSYQCRMYGRRLLMMGKDARNM